MRQLGGLGEEDVLHDQVVKAAQEAHGASLVGLAARRVLADYVERLQLVVVHRLEHLAEVIALLRGKRRTAPCACELGMDGRLLEVLETGKPRRYGAHVSPALDIVLPAEGIQPTGKPTDLTREQSQVDEREDVVCGVVMLGDP